MSDKTIKRITKYLADSPLNRQVRFADLNPELQDSIIEAINHYHAEEI